MLRKEYNLTGFNHQKNATHIGLQSNLEAQGMDCFDSFHVSFPCSCSSDIAFLPRSLRL